VKIVITGNPGVGKHTCAKLVADAIGGDIVDINTVAIQSHHVSAVTDKGLDIDVAKVRTLISKRLRLKNKASVIVVGHLAPYVSKKPDIDVAIVLRRSPYKLANSLKKRGYSKEKIRENIASEILGVTLYDSLRTFGRNKVIEIDTTDRTPNETAKEIIELVSGSAAIRKSRRYEKGPMVDWLSLVSERNDFSKFFDYSPPSL
jgi:adenylate kinase